MRWLRKYAWVALVSARSNLAYMAEVLSRAVFLAVILYIFLQLWKVAYAQTHSASLGGLSLSEMLWYLLIAECVMLSGPRVTQAVDEDVRTGALAVQLIKPISYPLYRLSVTLGERLVRFLVCAVAGSAVTLVLVGPIQLSALGLLFFAVSLPLAFVVDFLGNFLIGLGAFWMEDTSGLNIIYSRLTMIFGGMMIPLDLFPDAIRPVVAALPFASIVYGPARMFVKPSADALTALIAQQCIAIVLFSCVVALVYGIAVRRVHAHGG